ncbi:hypothetical protein J5751_01680 [bacterium]|nr:hypothetical protein [bacterium]
MLKVYLYTPEGQLSLPDHLSLTPDHNVKFALFDGDVIVTSGFSLSI